MLFNISLLVLKCILQQHKFKCQKDSDKEIFILKEAQSNISLSQQLAESSIWMKNILLKHKLCVTKLILKIQGQNLSFSQYPFLK